MLKTIIKSQDQLFLIYTNLGELMKFRGYAPIDVLPTSIDVFNKMTESATSIIYIPGAGYTGVIVREDSFNTQALTTALRPLQGKGNLYIVTYNPKNMTTVAKYGSEKGIITESIPYERLYFNFPKHIVFNRCTRLSDDDIKQWERADCINTKTQLSSILVTDTLSVWYGFKVGDIVAVDVPSKLVGTAKRIYRVIAAT